MNDDILLVNHVNQRFESGSSLHGLEIAAPAEVGTPASAGKAHLLQGNGRYLLAAMPNYEPVAASTAITLSGTPTAGDTVTVEIAGISNTYTVLLGDTLTDIATALAGLINGDTDLTGVVTATDNASVVGLVADDAGIQGNSIPVSVTVGGTTVATVPGATLEGGAIAAVTPPSYATGWVTVHDNPSPTNPDQVDVTIGGFLKSYVVMLGDTVLDIVQALAADINSDPNTSTLVEATTEGGTLILTAATPGPIGNAVTLSASATGSTTVSVSGATLGGGTPPGSASGGTFSKPFLLGTINTVADFVFTLPSWSGGQEVLFLDGAKLLDPLTQYSRSGNTITLTPPIDPGVSAPLELWAVVSIGDLTMNPTMVGYSDWEEATATIDPDVYTLPLPAQATSDVKVFVGLVPTPQYSGLTQNWRRNSASDIEFLTGTPSDPVWVQYAVATLPEAASATKLEFQYSASGALDLAPPNTVLDGVRRAVTNIQLEDFVVVIEDNGTAGSTSLDFQVSSTPNGTFTSVLSAPVTVAFGAGDYATASGTLTTVNIAAGQWLRVVLTGAATDLSQVRVFAAYHKV